MAKESSKGKRRKANKSIGLEIDRKFTSGLDNSFSGVVWSRQTSRISNPVGSVVFEMADAEIPADWSQVAADIMITKYFRKAGVPQLNSEGKPHRDHDGKPVHGPERSVCQVIKRLTGCWRHWGENHGYFTSPDDAQAFEVELAYMLVHQMAAPNSPQWFNTGLAWAYDITGPAQGHFYVEPAEGEVKPSLDAYSRPRVHACQP